jgi:TonB family protein
LQFDSSALSEITLTKPANEMNKESKAFAAPNVTLKTKKPMITAQGNSKQISGTVLTKEGEPLPGVSVQIKGTTSGVLTDQNGNYSIPLPAPSANLVFSHIGYSTEELVINSPNVTGDVVLDEDASALSEVVIVGGKSSKDSRTKSMSPMPVIGMTAFKKYLIENVKYTPTAREKGIEGTVVVEFLVSDNGDITDLEVKEGLGYGLDEEAIRLIQSGPRWKSGSKAKQAEKKKVVVKIPFTLK